MEKKGANKLAIIETEEIGPDTSIAEFAIIRKGAKLGRGVIVHPFVVIESGVSIGDGVEVYPFSHIGKEPNGAGAVARERELRSGRDRRVRNDTPPRRERRPGSRSA